MFLQKLFSEFMREVLDCDHQLDKTLVTELQRVHDCVTGHRDKHDQHALFADTDAPPIKPSALDFSPGNSDLPDNGTEYYFRNITCYSY